MTSSGVTRLFILSSAGGETRFAIPPYGLRSLIRSMPLNLHDGARLGGGALRYHQIAPFVLALARHQLTDRPDGVDDGRTGGVGHEGRERLQRTVAIGAVGEADEVGLLRLQ